MHGDIMDIGDPPPFNLPAPETMRLLLTRRSAKAKAMEGPGPSEAEIAQILAAAARVPDHGKLFPWRFVLIEGEARARLGRMLVEILRESESVTPEREAQEANRFTRAPLVVAVVSRARSGQAIPEWEQILSAGAVCQNLLVAAHALGYVATWLTEWCAYDPRVLARLGLGASERMAGFIHIGHSSTPLEERARPDPARIVSRF